MPTHFLPRCWLVASCIFPFISQHLDYTFACFSSLTCLFCHPFSFKEYRAGCRFLSQSPWHESLRVRVLFAEPGLTLPAYRNSPTAVWCRQAPQSDLWTRGDRAHLCQSQYRSSDSFQADGVCECICSPVQLSEILSVLRYAPPSYCLFYITNPYLSLRPRRCDGGHSCVLVWIFSNLFQLGIKVARWNNWVRDGM